MTVKENFVTNENIEFRLLVETVIDNLNDEIPIVNRTAKRLLLELKKMYPEIIQHIFNSLSNEHKEKSKDVFGFEILSA